MAGVTRDALFSAEDRYRYLHDRLAHLVDIRSHFACKAFKKAGLLVGADDQMVRRRLWLYARRGEAPWPVPMLPDDAVGYVYTIRPAGFPHVLKIGFSLEPEKRLAVLQAQCKYALVLADAEPGTMVDEAVAHHRHAARRITGEWFFSSEVQGRDLPPFLSPSSAEIVAALRRAV